LQVQVFGTGIRTGTGNGFHCQSSYLLWIQSPDTNTYNGTGIRCH
jgi:hypothetical protein